MKKKHIIWFDNLFISFKFFFTFRNYGIEAAGIVRIGQTKREENEEKK
jgi:hypothetical protein